MSTNDIITYDKVWFDWYKYIDMQSNSILDRMEKFENRLYLEIGWKFLYDPHASRVLPWFFPDSKKRIFSKIKEKADVIFCINAIDLKLNRQLSSDDISYNDYCLSMIDDIKNQLWIISYISINRVNDDNLSYVKDFSKLLKQKWYNSYFRFDIKWYPNDVKYVLSDLGYWRDDYIPVNKDIVLVTWAASSSWKMSTCLWQIYLETIDWKDSWYAKYETFPIWNLPLDHPVNLAYEAATADIWDYNVIDSYHKDAYKMLSVNYNRDIEAFDIVKKLSVEFLEETNFTNKYKSPTDMWINTAWFCILDEEIVKKASIEEIDRRINWYKKIIDRWNGSNIWLERCNKLKSRLK